MAAEPRGPSGALVGGRLIDLSWTAAWKLGYIGEGSALVEVESLLPGQTLAVAAPRSGNPGIQSPPAPAVAEDPIAAMAAAEPEPPLPQVQDARGHFLQLGAFGNRANADLVVRVHLSETNRDALGEGHWPMGDFLRELGRIGDPVFRQALPRPARAVAGRCRGTAGGRAPARKPGHDAGHRAALATGVRRLSRRYRSRRVCREHIINVPFHTNSRCDFLP